MVGWVREEMPNIMPVLSRVRGSEIIVRPTDLRKSKEYVVFYHTWVWGFLTGKLDEVFVLVAKLS